MFATLTVHVWRAWTLLEQGELPDAEQSHVRGLEGQRLWGVTPAGTAQAAGMVRRC